MGYAQRREETARARMPQPTGDHRAPHADAGGGARPTCGLADEVERVVGTGYAIFFFRLGVLTPRGGGHRRARVALPQP